MTSIDNQPKCDRDDVEIELTRILYEYERLINNHGRPYSDDNVDAVNVLLNDVLFEQSLVSYSNASISALRALASGEVGIILRQKMGEVFYETFCKMLAQMVAFCSVIQNNERCLLELNIMRFGHMDTTGVPFELIKDLKIEYENKLQKLKEGIELKRLWEYNRYLKSEPGTYEPLGSED